MPTIEDNLGRIATALEKIAENGGSLNIKWAQVGEVSEAQVDVTADDKVTKAASDKRIANEAKAKADADAKAKADANAKADAEAAAAKVKADAEAAAAAAPSTSKATKDDVRKALQGFREIEGTPAMLEVLKSFGAANLNELKESQYDEVVAKVS